LLKSKKNGFASRREFFGLPAGSKPLDHRPGRFYRLPHHERSPEEVCAGFCRAAPRARSL